MQVLFRCAVCARRVPLHLSTQPVRAVCKTIPYSARQEVVLTATALAEPSVCRVPGPPFTSTLYTAPCGRPAQEVGLTGAALAEPGVFLEMCT